MLVLATHFYSNSPKSKLPELIKKAQSGEQVIITSGRKKTPVIELKPVVTSASRRLGFWKHLNIEIPDSFYGPLPEDELRAWEGEE